MSLLGPVIQNVNVSKWPPFFIDAFLLPTNSSYIFYTKFMELFGHFLLNQILDFTKPTCFDSSFLTSNWYIVIQFILSFNR